MTTVIKMNKNNTVARKTMIEAFLEMKENKKNEIIVAFNNNGLEGSIVFTLEKNKFEWEFTAEYTNESGEDVCTYMQCIKGLRKNEIKTCAYFSSERF